MFELLNNDFFIYAVTTSFLLSLVAAPLGVFLTLKRMSLMGDAISHSLLPGMALSLMIFGFSTLGLLLGGLVAGLVVLGLMFWITEKSFLKDDSVLALIYLTLSSLGIILLSISDVKIDLMHFLFGNILLMPKEWIYLIAGSGVLVLIGFSLIYKSLIQTIVDPEYSQFLKISESRIKNIFYFLVLWVLILSFYSVGTILALGFLIIPAMIAKLFARAIKKQILLAAFFGWIISFTGILLSFEFNLPTGPSIILFGGLLFLTILPLQRFKKLMILVILCIPFSVKADSNSNIHGPRVLYSFSLLKSIGDELLEGVTTQTLGVDSLIPAEKSIHSYSILPTDTVKLKSANLFFVIGLGFENFNISDMVKRFPTLKIVNLSENIPYLKDKDPHIWNHPLNVIYICKRILKELILLLPEEKEKLNSNFKRFETSILSLHRKYLKLFNEISLKQIIVSHNSFSYLGMAYQIDIFSPSGFASHDHAKPIELIQLRKLIEKNKKIPIFREESANNSYIEHLAKEAKIPISGTLNGESFSVSKDKMFRYQNYLLSNLEMIYRALIK